MGRKKKKPQESSNGQQIMLVAITALLSFLGSIIGFYFTAPYLASQVINQKNHEYRSSAYAGFLNSMVADHSSGSVKLISLNQLVVNVNTDHSIQIIEDSIYALSKENKDNQLFVKLLSNMQVLKLYSSKKGEQYIDDFMAVLLDNDFTINWESHSVEVQKVRNSWIDNTGEIIGWEPRVTDEERAKFIILSAQYVELVKLFKAELVQGSI
jgi:hypothetical protein